MAKFDFPRGTTEEEGPSEEGGDFASERSDERSVGSRRILVLAGIGVLLIGGFYLANQLFLSPAPSPTPPARPALPVPPPPLTMPPAQTIPAQPTPSVPSAKEETRPAAPAMPAKEATPVSPGPGKATTPPKVAKGPASAPGKAEPGKAPPARPEAKAAPKLAPAAPGIYSLQVGAMVVQENAETLKRKLDANGFPAAVRKGTAFVSRQVVTVGTPSGKQEAEELSRRLNVDGFPSQQVAVDGKFTPQIGAFFNLDEAIDLARELQKKNYVPKITARPENTVVFQVRHGKFNSRADAVRRGEELKSKGYGFMVVRD